jgi:cytochrome c5
MSRRAVSLALAGALVAVAAACGSAASKAEAPPGSALAASPPADVLGAWDVIYGVLQHPRCMNCHPAGDAPLQGDLSLPHAQNVQRGPDGHGLYALRCDGCHAAQTVSDTNLPPGVPGWHLPSASEKLIFENRSSGDLCRQLRDPAQNGHQTPEQLVEHMERAPLVLWGWSPGPGRAPVSTPHDELMRAMRTWVDGGCGCP